ncbi:hypothetical protein [Nocardia puris]|uniref:hypothetical protein n=1 Tax=Nocardia puris TaxID=208602 RepID=UPI00350E55C9
MTVAIAVSRVIGSNTAWVLCSIRGPTARMSAKNTESSVPRSAMRAKILEMLDVQGFRRVGARMPPRGLVVAHAHQEGVEM